MSQVTRNVHLFIDADNERYNIAIEEDGYYRIICNDGHTYYMTPEALQSASLGYEEYSSMSGNKDEIMQFVNDGFLAE